MKDNGTDRDIALAFVTVVDELATLLGTLNDNLYVPHIVTQPTDQTEAVNDNAVFTVVANNVSVYEWQYAPTQITPSWRTIHSGTTGADTATLTVPVTEPRYGYLYRCKITGKDGSIIYTDSVKIIEPEPEPEPVG